MSNLKDPGYIIENLTDYVWVLDIETLSFAFHNPAVYRVTGYTPKEAKGIPLEEILTPPSFKNLTQKVFTSLNRMKSGTADAILVETEILRKDGTKTWLESRLNFFEENDRKLVLGISRDISERRGIEAEREELVARLKKTLAEKEQLLKENRVLKGLLPICSNCNKIRDKEGAWHNLEEYIEARSKAKFTHTICPDCTQKLYPGVIKSD